MVLRLLCDILGGWRVVDNCCSPLSSSLIQTICSDYEGLSVGSGINLTLPCCISGLGERVCMKPKSKMLRSVNKCELSMKTDSKLVYLFTQMDGKVQYKVHSQVHCSGLRGRHHGGCCHSCMHYFQIWHIRKLPRSNTHTLAMFSWIIK